MQIQEFVENDQFSPALIAKALRTTRGGDRRHPRPAA